MQQCGVCAYLGELFRRLMCLGGSRRGSSESHYQELADDDDRRGGICIVRPDDPIFIPMGPATCPIGSHRSSVASVLTASGTSLIPSTIRKLSESEKLLLETLDTRQQRPLHTGRFLTMHKRRRKRLTTRSLVGDPALLDDIHHGQVQCVLNRVWQWPFNAFTLDTVTGGRSLPVLCVHLFHWYGLMDTFDLDVVRVWKLFTLVEEGYHSTNPYHNSIHATDVTQAMHCFLQEDKIRAHLTPLEIMASLIGAVTHDLDHPGVNQPFLIATSNHLAALYENTSVLENHHWRSAIGCLLESNVTEGMSIETRNELGTQISSLILATDITRQNEFLTRFKRYMDQDLLDMKRAEDRHFILQIALKCADISNPCRPWDVSRKWSHKVCEEFFRQGDYERQLNLPVTSLCNRQSTSISKIQHGFFRFVVAPLFDEWHRFLNTELSHLMMNHLRTNQSKWEALVINEQAEETRTEISEAEVLDEDIGDSETEEPQSVTTPTSPPILLGDGTTTRVGRRHSVPLSLPKSEPMLPRTIVRRESLPQARGHRSSAVSPLPILALEVDEDELQQLGHSSLSLLSSSSGGGGAGGPRSSASEQRPVSAENLLPEPSIASITTSLEASRLSSVIHGNGSNILSVAPPSGPTSRYLTRQQTFPPLQPYARQRYMSTTAEMSSCSEAVAELGSRSSESSRTDLSLSRQQSDQQNENDSPPASTTVTTPPSISSRSTKRETSPCGKAPKIAKLSEPPTTRCQKENVDPRQCELEWRNRGQPLQNLSRRRGSAPVNLTTRGGNGVLSGNGGSLLTEDPSSQALVLRGGAGSNDRFARRGSVPADVTRQSILRPPLGPVNAGPPHCLPPARRPPEIECSALGNLENFSSSGNGGSGRRGSGTPLSPHELVAATASAMAAANGSNKNGNGKRKKVLKRRSSGGPEMFSSSGWRMPTSSSTRRLATESLEPTRRRGSLPITLSCDVSLLS